MIRMPFEYWNLPPCREPTRIVNCEKVGKYIVFTRDDGKQCKYDLSSGEVIGFRGKPVKRLSGQLRGLSCVELFGLIKNRTYKEYFEYVWKWHPNGQAWVFFEYTMPNYIGYEQFFTSGFTNIENRFLHSFSEVPKGLFKLCETYNVKLTNALFDEYVENPDAFNILYDQDFGKCSTEKMIEAMCYGHTLHIERTRQVTRINPENLLSQQVTRHTKGKHLQNSYFFRLIKDFGYNPKLLMNYVDSVKINRRFKKAIFRDIYDYADMMTQMYEDFDRYPSNLTRVSIKTAEDYNKLQIDYSETEYQKRNVLDYECEIDGFKFIYPRKVQDIKKEGVNQHNCVATYIDRVLSDYCHIMFMRPVSNIEDSYITLEIVNNKIVQAKRKYNQLPSPEEIEIIHKWNEKYKKRRG